MKEQSYASTPSLGPCGLLQGETLPYHKSMRARGDTFPHINVDVLRFNLVPLCLWRKSPRNLSGGPKADLDAVNERKVPAPARN